MVEFDPVLGAVIVGLVGIALWVVTNWHLVRTGRAIKADIDVKRSETQDFVKDQLASMREDLGGAVELDAGPLMTAIKEELLPEITDRVENIKATILGKLGYGTKALKAAAEGVVELVGEEAVERAGTRGDWRARLARYGLDDDWMRTHKTAAVGFDMIQEALAGGEPVELGRGAPAKPTRGSPPKGFG